MCDAGPVTVYRIRIQGPPTLAIRVATELADADGVELISSEPPEVLGNDAVALDVAVDGERSEVADALVRIRDGLPKGASIDFVDD
jgi:hypothetical protein